MQNRIAYYIVSLLYLNGKVRIPGIGNITHRYQQASVNDSDASIAPPQAHGEFTAEKHSKNRLLEKFVAYQSQVSRTKARREIARFTDQIQSGIKNTGKVELKYLGTFAIQDDAMQFSPNEEILNPGHSALPKLILPSRTFAVEEESIPYAAKDSTFPEMGSTAVEYGTLSHEELVFEEPSSTLTSAVVEEQDERLQSEGQTASPEKLEFIPDKLEETIVPATVAPVYERHAIPVVSEPVIKGKPEISERKPHTDAKGISETKKKREIPLAVPIAAMIMIGLLIAAFLFYQSRTSHQETAIVIDSTLTKDQESTPSSSDEIESNENIPKENVESDTKVALADTGTRDESEANHITKEEPVITENETPVSAGHESIFAATGECTLVVGAFSLGSNAERMVSRLQAMGYTVQTQPRGSLTQVGVPVDCKAQNLRVVIDFLRKNVESKTWVLRPN